MRDSDYAALLQLRHTKYGRIRGMVVGEGGRSSGVLHRLYRLTSRQTTTNDAACIQEQHKRKLLSCGYVSVGWHNCKPKQSSRKNKTCLTRCERASSKTALHGKLPSPWVRSCLFRTATVYCSAWFTIMHPYRPIVICIAPFIPGEVLVCVVPCSAYDIIHACHNRGL